MNRETMHRIRLFAQLGIGTAAIVAMAGVWSAVSGQASRTGPGGASAQLVEDLVVGNHILANEEVLDGLGHLSVRHDRRPDRFLLARDLAPALVTVADLIEYDLDGNAVSPNAPRGYQERFIHAAIYKARPDVRAVVHAHTPSIVAFADSDVPMRPMSHVAAFLLPGVSRYEIRDVAGHRGMLVNDTRTGAALATSLDDKAVVLMRGHGYAIVGSSIPEVVSRAINLDQNAHVQMQSMSLGGTVHYLTSADAAAPPAARPTAITTEYPRAWAFWKERATRR